MPTPCTDKTCTGCDGEPDCHPYFMAPECQRCRTHPPLSTRLALRRWRDCDPADRKFTFTIELRWPAGSVDEVVADALYAAGCNDGLFVVLQSIPQMDFMREAPSLAEAVGSALRDVAKVDGLSVVAVHIDPDEEGTP